MLAVLLLGLGLLIAVLASFARGAGQGVVTLIVAVVAFLVGVVIIRVYLELVIVVFRIAEHVRDIAQQKRGEP